MTISTTELEPMLTMADIASHFQVNIRTVRQWRASGFLPKPDLNHGKTVRWRQSTILNWVDEESERAR
jgi:predicted DNA-binding transcriptional regulator AlpA